MAITIAATAVFILSLAVLIALRTRIASKVEIKSSDILLALIPVILWLVLTGRIRELTVGDVKIVSAIKSASQSPIEPYVSKLTELPVESIEVNPKEGVRDIPRLIEKKSQALSFQMGLGRYWGPAINEYFNALIQYPFFRYIVINNKDQIFFGMADARQLESIIRSPSEELYFQRFAQWLNASNESELAGLPGFISAEKSLKIVSDRLQALQLMNALDVQVLPVVDNSGRFFGIVDRSKLTTSIVVDVAESLETGN